MAIIISKKGTDAQIIEKSEFKKEAILQEYIHENPETIPVYELEKDKKLLVVKREFKINLKSIDALAVDIHNHPLFNQVSSPEEAITHFVEINH